MTRPTFILIVTIFGFYLGFLLFFLPEFAVSSFSGNPNNIHETSTMRFFGVLHIGSNFIGLAIRTSADTKVVRAYLLGTGFNFLASLALGLYYVLTNQVPFLTSNWLDATAWTSLGLGCLYFWNKEK